MPTKGIEMYHIFNPQNWPSANTHFYGIEEMADIAELYAPNEEMTLIVQEWQFMLQKIIIDKSYCQYKELDTIFFWKHFLTKGIVPPLIDSIIRKVLAIPIGSADAERSFSILFHIRSKRRNSLAPETLQDFLRIRMNGPRNVFEFAAIHYAQLWKNYKTSGKKNKRGNVLTDDPRWGPKIKQPPSRGTNEDDEFTGEIQKKLLDGSNLF